MLRLQEAKKKGATQMTKQKQKEKEKFVDDLKLVLMNGETVLVSVESDYEETIYEIGDKIKEALRKNGLWYGSDWTDIKITYLGTELDYVDMKKVLGISY